MRRYAKLFFVLVEMNAKEFLRDPVAAFFTLAFPLFFAVMFGYSASYRAAPSFPLGVVDLQGNEDSRRVIAALSSRPALSVRMLSRAAADVDLNKGKISALLVVGPVGIASAGSAPRLHLVALAAQMPWAKIVLDAGLAGLAAKTGPPTPAPYTAERITAHRQSEFNFIFPGLLAMALLQLGLFATASPLLKARDRGTLRHISITPTPRTLLLGTQLALRGIIAAVQVLFLFLVGRLLFQVEVAGSVLSLALILGFGAVMLISMGYAIAGLAPTQESGGVFVLLMNFGMLAFGQVFFDLSNVGGLGKLVQLVPVTYLADGCRQAVLGTPGMFSVQFDLLMMALWSAVAVTVALRTFRFDMEPR